MTDDRMRVRAPAVGPGGRGAEAPRPPNGGAGQGDDRRGTKRVSDPAEVVQRAAAAIRLMAGETFTPKTVSMLARLVWLEFRRLTRGEIKELCGAPIVMGKPIDEAAVMERARQIAVIVLERGAA
jgi:hypothetical protein